MEELFEVIIAIAVIVGSLIKTMSKANKVKQNAPGKAAAPVRPAAPAAPVKRPAEPARPVTPAVPTVKERPTPAMPTVKPTVQPSGGNIQLPEFWQQVSRVLKEELAPEKTDPGHEAAGPMPEGDSRECGHGSVGGSMAYEAHQEGGERKTIEARSVKPQGNRKEAGELPYRPVMNAEEMRRAVVMAEILKRPQERMAEQARRWNAR